MQINSPAEIIRQADRTMRRAGSREPARIARELGLLVRDVPFTKQKGVYTVIRRNRFVFLKEDLDPAMRDIVLLHEIGHDVLHRDEAGWFAEFNLFDMAGNRMEYEANLFAAQIMLPDEEILEYIREGLDAAQIAQAMNSDINLVALKVSALKMQGYELREPEHRNDFLK